MWAPFIVDDCNYLIKYTQGSSIKIRVTNFRSIWVEDIASDDLIARFLAINPLLDSNSLTSEEILEKIKELIDHIHDKTAIALIKENDEIKLELKHKLSEFFIRCKFNLRIEDETMFFNEFTIPLIQSVQYLEVRQKKLFDSLEKKDKEIQQHQLEGGELSRKSLVTKIFDKNTLLESAPEQLLVNVFGKSKQFLDVFTSKFGVIANTTPKVKTDAADNRPRKKLKTGTSAKILD